MNASKADKVSGSYRSSEVVRSPDTEHDSCELALYTFLPLFSQLFAERRFHAKYNSILWEQTSAHLCAETMLC